MKAILLAGGLALIISLLGTHFAIRVLSSKGYGQEIRDDGPTSHHTKRGTPTMGGIVIITAAVVGYFSAKLFSQDAPSASALLLLFLFVGMGFVGFLDDFIKIYKQRNLGLRSKAKMIGQTVIAVAFGWLALNPMLENDRGRTPASDHISFIRDSGWLVLPAAAAVILIWLFITGFSNAVNLTDGLDGLATGAGVMVFGAYTIVNIWQNNQSCARSSAARPATRCATPSTSPSCPPRSPEPASGSCGGTPLPRPIFMGDTGSLSLGGALAGLAVLTRTELLLVILGGLFVVETLSVMLQVGYFKATKGKRVFRMAPLHHHFEMLGWEQITVVIRFWIITGLCVAAGLGVFYAEWVAGA